MTDRYHADIDAIASWERGESGVVGRATGPRREPPAVCHYCGGNVPPGPRFGLEACCDKDACRWAEMERRR